MKSAIVRRDSRCIDSGRRGTGQGVRNACGRFAGSRRQSRSRTRGAVPCDGISGGRARRFEADHGKRVHTLVGRCIDPSIRIEVSGYVHEFGKLVSAKEAENPETGQRLDIRTLAAPHFFERKDGMSEMNRPAGRDAFQCREHRDERSHGA